MFRSMQECSEQPNGTHQQHSLAGTRHDALQACSCPLKLLLMHPNKQAQVAMPLQPAQPQGHLGDGVKGPK